jgi:hypothetical protein
MIIDIKWNGTNWNSSHPQPIVAYHRPSTNCGIDGPLLVFKDDLIYIYGTNTDTIGTYTELAIA